MHKRDIAIIGSGIAGLGAAHHLDTHFDVTVFDRNAYAGGHTNTVNVGATEQLPVDTGFMVYNQVTYPNLTRLFTELGVRSVPTAMSFGVQDVASGIEYGGSSVSQLFAQRRNLFRPRFLRALARIDRFNREAREAMGNPRYAHMTIAEYAGARGYGEDFLRLYLLPMSSAVWSTPFEDVRKFPVATLLRFFDNHGLLGGLAGHHQWLTVAGGAKTYVDAIRARFHGRIVLGNAVTRVFRDANGVTLRLADGSTARFSRVLFACHADEAIALLDAPTPDEHRVLRAFRYQRNIATLHTDPAPMPRTRRAWASWNYRLDGRGATTVYWMNSLQPWLAGEPQNYFVSIDGESLIDPQRVIRTMEYHHPIFDLAAIDAQRELPSLETALTFFCGSYFGYGFHEDAYRSGLNAVAAIRAASEDVAA